MDVIEDFVAAHRAGLVQWEAVNTAIQAYFLARGERRTPIQRSLQSAFDVRQWSDQETVQQLRFNQQHLPLLQRCLEIPDEVYIPERRYRVGGRTALCILLRRLAYPNRLCDLEPIFGMSSSALSSMFHFMVPHIMTRKEHLLSRLDSHSWLNDERLAYYAEAVAEKGAPLPNCWGFIDGTTRHICRPSVNQEEYYSGHKRYHCLKFQSTVTPDGLIINLLGAFIGRRHDAGIFRDTGFSDQLRRLCQGRPNTYVLYGDAAYPISDLLLKPFPTTTDDGNALQFNRDMSKVRQAVEWGFGNVVRLFAFVDFHKNMKLLKQDVSSMYKVACLLTNCHTCLYGCQTSDYFSISPPTLEDYLS